MFSVLTVVQDGVVPRIVETNSTTRVTSRNDKQNVSAVSPKFSSDPLKKGAYRSNQDPAYVGMVCSTNATHRDEEDMIANEGLIEKSNYLTPSCQPSSKYDFEKSRDDDAMTLETVKSCSTMDHEESTVILTNKPVDSSNSESKQSKATHGVAKKTIAEATSDTNVLVATLHKKDMLVPTSRFVVLGGPRPNTKESNASRNLVLSESRKFDAELTSLKGCGYDIYTYEPLLPHLKSYRSSNIGTENLATLSSRVAVSEPSSNWIETKEKTKNNISRNTTVRSIGHSSTTETGTNSKSTAIDRHPPGVIKITHLQDILITSKYQVLSLEPETEVSRLPNKGAEYGFNKRNRIMSTDLLSKTDYNSKKHDPFGILLDLAIVKTISTAAPASFPEVIDGTIENSSIDDLPFETEQDLEIPPFVIDNSGNVVACQKPVVMLQSVPTPDDDEKTVKTKNTTKRPSRSSLTNDDVVRCCSLDMDAIPEDISTIVVESMKQDDFVVDKPTTSGQGYKSNDVLMTLVESIIVNEPAARPSKTNRFQVLSSSENGSQLIPSADNKSPATNSAFSSDLFKVTLGPLPYDSDPLLNQLEKAASYAYPMFAVTMVAAESASKSDKSYLTKSEGKNKDLIQKSETQARINLDRLVSENDLGTQPEVEAERAERELNQERAINTNDTVLMHGNQLEVVVSIGNDTVEGVAAETASRMDEVGSIQTEDENKLSIQKSAAPTITIVDSMVSDVGWGTQPENAERELNHENAIDTNDTLLKDKSQGEVVVFLDDETAEIVPVQQSEGSKSGAGDQGVSILSLASNNVAAGRDAVASATNDGLRDSEQDITSRDIDQPIQEPTTEESGGLELSSDPTSLGSNSNDESSKTDITVYGCTSFTAKHVLKYFMQTSLHVPYKVRITLGGRNKEKLASLHAVLIDQMNSICTVENNNASGLIFDTYVAESSDIQALTAMVKRTKVVLSCAGPFARYGSNLVAACAVNGTDYVDITGEVNWVGHMRIKYGSAARQSGARIISFCGFDSVPSDLSIYAAAQALKNKFGTGESLDIENGSTWHFVQGGLNGGTLKTIMDHEMNWKKCFSQPVPFLVEDPLTLTSPEVRFNPDFQQVKNRLAWAEWLNLLPSFDTFLMLGVSVPFFMAVANAKIVHASAIALNYGSNFVYRERLLPIGFKATTQLSVLSIIAAVISLVGVLLAIIIIKIPYIGERLVNTFLPSGAGPSEESCRRGAVEVYAQVTTSKDKIGNIHRANCFMKFVGDPGNYVTAQCVCESAWALLLDRNELPKRSSDGFGTPAELIGGVLLNRLMNSKVRPVVVTTNVRKNVDKNEWRIYR